MWYSTFPTPRPAIYVTCVREPRAQRISGILYVEARRYRGRARADVAADVSRQLEAATGFHSNVAKRIGGGEPTCNSPREACLKARAARAARALDEVFAVVGLTERYETFYAMLAALLPAAPARFWEREVARRENPSVHSSAAIQALLSPRASAALDRALRYERVIYDAAVVVHDRRCVAHLGSEECR